MELYHYVLWSLQEAFPQLHDDVGGHGRGDGGSDGDDDDVDGGGGDDGITLISIKIPCRFLKMLSTPLISGSLLLFTFLLPEMIILQTLKVLFSIGAKKSPYLRDLPPQNCTTLPYSLCSHMDLFFYTGIIILYIIYLFTCLSSPSIRM